jgi:hypothetical protein
VHLECVDAARKSYAAITEGRVDLCFLANEPAREEGVVFTAPYVLIEGVYVTDADSPLQTSEDVDHEGVRIGVRDGSAYDLFLSRSLQNADIVRADEATDVYEQQGLDVAAGVRQPMAEYVAATGGRILEPAFMQINQAVGITRALDADTGRGSRRPRRGVEGVGVHFGSADAERCRRHGGTAGVGLRRRLSHGDGIATKRPNLSLPSTNLGDKLTQC